MIALWEQCGLTRPWNDPRKDIARKVAVQPELFLVGLVDGRIMATVMAGYEGHRGWVNYLAVAPEHRSRGFGQALMAEVERLLLERGCPRCACWCAPRTRRCSSSTEAWATRRTRR